MLTLGKVQILSTLDKLNLEMIDIKQATCRGVHSTDIEVEGFSRSFRAKRRKKFRIMSVKPDTICRVIEKNWY